MLHRHPRPQRMPLMLEAVVVLVAPLEVVQHPKLQQMAMRLRPALEAEMLRPQLPPVVTRLRDVAVVDVVAVVVVVVELAVQRPVGLPRRLPSLKLPPVLW